MKVFMNAKITGFHKLTSFISLALVAENGRSFYAEFNDYTKSQITPWMTETLFPALTLQHPKVMPTTITAVPDLEHPKEGVYPNDARCKGPSGFILDTLLRWLQQFKGAELCIWGDVPVYDWMLFTKLVADCDSPDTPIFPANINPIPMDLATLIHVNGFEANISRLKLSGSKELPSPHNALWDARVMALCHETLMPEMNRNPKEKDPMGSTRL